MRVNLVTLPVGTLFIFERSPNMIGEICETFATKEKFVNVKSEELQCPPLPLSENIWEDINFLIDVEWSEVEEEPFVQLTFDNLERGD